MVRMAQKQGMKGTKGDWKEFLGVHDKRHGASLSDPTRRSNNVLVAFLKTFVKEDDLKVIHIVGRSFFLEFIFYLLLVHHILYRQ
jgi:RNA exonuclease 1